MRIVLFLILYIAQLSVSYKNFIPCANVHSTIIYLLHHMLDVYIFFGPLFIENTTESLIHIITTLLIIIHWFTNNYECILTTYLNELCGWERNRWLDSITLILQKQSKQYYYHSFHAFLVILFDIFFIISANYTN
jgi:hypothetical protein